MLAMGYPGIFLLMLVETLFPPIPSEIIMPYAGFLAAQDEMHLAGILTAGTLGALSGALLLYYFGMRFGEQRARRWMERYGRFALLSVEDLDKALHVFDRHGRAAVLIARVIPGMRSIISVPAGLREMPTVVFLILTIVGTLVWNLILSIAGYILGHNWQQVVALIESYEKVIYVLLASLVLIYLGRRLFKRFQKQQA
jgi:membrane protein DedA with SNARE-associated domain